MALLSVKVAGIYSNVHVHDIVERGILPVMLLLIGSPLLDSWHEHIILHATMSKVW